MSRSQLSLDSLPEHEKLGLAVVAMLGSDRSRTAIARILRRLGLRLPNPKGRGDQPPNATNLLPILRRWGEREWVGQTRDDRWFIAQRAQHLVLSFAARTPVLARAYQACREDASRYSVERELLDARYALYTGDADTLRARLRGHRGRSYDIVLLAELLPIGAPGGAVALLPDDIRCLLLEDIITGDILEGVEPQDDLIVAFAGLSGSSEPKLRAALHQQYTLAGRDHPAGLVLDEAVAASHEARALAFLVRGDFDAARASVRDAWAASVGSKKTRKNRLETPVAPLLTLVLATGSTEDRGIALAQLHSPGARKADAQTYAVIRAFLERPDAMPMQVRPDWQSLLILTLVAGWVGEPPAGTGELGAVFTAHAHGLADHGFAWSGHQLAAAATAFGAPVPHEPLEHPLTAMCAKKEPWELALDALETELGAMTTGPKDDARAERLAWEVELFFEDEYRVLSAEADTHRCGRLHVAPRLQKRTKRGWTKGRPVALRRLAEASGDEVWMTHEDLRVAAHVTGRRDYYGTVHYDFDDTVARALVDHPRVFWEGDKAPVEIAAGAPSLRVERSGGRIKVRFHPRALASHAVICEHPGPNQLVVYDRADAPGRLLDIVGREIDLPEAAEARVEQVVTRVAPFVAVHSDVDAAEIDADEVDADPRPVVELARHGGGLRAEVAVLPLGAEGPRARAGEGAASMLALVDGRTVRCRRDLAEEKHRHAMLLLACPDLRTDRTVITDLVACLEFLETLRGVGDAVTVRWRDGDRLSVAGTAASSGLRLAIATADEWFSVSGEVDVDEALVVDLKTMLANLPRKSGRFVPLDDERFVALTADLEARLESLHAARADDDDELNLHPVAASVVAGWADDVHTLKLDRPAGRRLKLAKEAYTKTFDIPATLDADLRDYQREGVLWMLRLAHWGAGACLADDMGLGKTVQALAVLLNRAPDGPALVVAPTSVCSGWLEQSARFAPSLRTRFVASTGDAGELSDLGAFDVVVCSYAVMTRAIEHLEAIEFTSVVLDEAQAIKNPGTRRAKAACRLRAAFRLTTTGTPIENRLSELWSLMRFLNPGFLGSAERFGRTFARPVQVDGDERVLSQLRALIDPFMLRRNKRDVLSELPPRTEIVLDVQPSAEERSFTEALRRNALEQLEAAGDRSRPSAIHVLAELTRLRLAACDPAIVDGGEAIPSSKLRVFTDLVEELIAGGHRALVFSQFVSFLERVRARLDRAEVTYQYLDGSTPAAERKRAVEAFQGGEGDLFLISLKAGGTGLNLTAADYVIHLDPWWNPAVEDQASDRAHRIGQTRPVTVYRLVTKGTVEERVLALHHDKRALASQLLSGQDGARPMDAGALLALLANT